MLVVLGGAGRLGERVEPPGSVIGVCSAGAAGAGGGSADVDSGHADVVAGVWGVYDGVAADVDAHVVQVAEPEDQVTGLQVGAGNRFGVLPLPLGVVAQADAVDGPGGYGEARAVVAGRSGGGPDVGLADEA